MNFLIFQENFLQKVLLFSSVLLLIGYVMYRAYFLSFTYDECLSYTMVSGRERYVAGTANNHFLNTVLMWLTYHLWGNNEFTLRLPNVAAFFIYLWFSIRLVLPQRNQIVLVFLGFTLLLFNTFLLDFFSLARGYGLSAAFFLAGFYYIAKPISVDESSSTDYEDEVNENIVWSIIYASLATFSNLTMINFLLTILVVGGIKHWKWRTKQLALSTYVIGGVLILTVLIYNIQHLFFLRAKKELYHGVATLNEAFSSGIEHLLYFVEPTPILIFTIKIVLIGIWLIGFGLICLTKTKQSFLFFSGSLFLILLLAIISENLLFGAKYPADRTNLIFILIGILFLYYTISALLEHSSLGKKIAIPFAIMISCLVGYHFSISANLSYSKVWQYDYSTKEFMKVIHQISIDHPEESYTISNMWVLDPSILYYQRKHQINLERPTREAPENKTVFIYSTWKEGVKRPNYTAISIFKPVGRALFIRNDYMKQYRSSLQLES